MSLIDLLDMVADADGGRVAVGAGGSATTYAELREAALAVAGHVRTAQAGSVVLIAPNSDSIPAVLFGADAAGVPFVPVNYRLSDEALGALVARNPGALVITGPGVVERLGSLDAAGVLSLDEVRTWAPTGEGSPAADGDGDGVAITLFTSGTTGPPKAALLRRRHLMAYVLANVDFLSADESEAALISVPPYHIAGMMSVLSSVHAGRRLVYLSSFTAESWVDVVATEGVTHAMVVPTMLTRILDVLEEGERELPTLKHLSSGGGRMPRSVIERALRLLPRVDFVNAYGLTETSSTIALLGPEDHREAAASTDPAIAARLGSVGRPLPSVELVVRDADGTPVVSGQVGEIWVRGDHIAGEYAGGRDLSPDGWFRTRDRGWLDAGGYLYLDGRLDDVIVRGGENIAPAEVEDVLLEQTEIIDAAVFGVPDEEWGEIVVAAVVLREGVLVDPDTIRERVRSRLRSSRTPSRITVVAELPYNETGKLQRRVLRESFMRSASA
ncbi:MAG: AMP-dependent synthetase [Pseudonocardia sp. SCN 72-86]|nr:MAG: AMP-dependent synthetase [Pseudonocardia sp. SCN 72-86]